MRIWGIVAILITTILSGCANSPYHQAKQDIARQYAELEQITDTGLRQQRFQEIAHRETLLEANHQVGMTQAIIAVNNALMYQAATQPKNYNVYLWGIR